MTGRLITHDGSILTHHGGGALLWLEVPSSRLAGNAYVALGSGIASGDAHQIVRGWVDALASQPADARELADWDVTLDPHRTPTSALAWLAQWKGERLRTGDTFAGQRAQVADAPGQRFATPAMVVAAARSQLTGDRSVRLDERTDGNGSTDPWHIRVTTLTSETPDDGAVVAAVKRAIPAGIVVNHRTIAGWLWQDVVDTYATWQDVLDVHHDWEHLVNEPPP